MRHAPDEPEDQSEVIVFLSQPASYGGEAASVARFETHGSIVFLAGDRAYKLKRAVRFPYMDFSSVERRRAMCERELKVNRRTAPMLYLEVRPVVRAANGSLRFGSASEDGSALDWVVVMQRFDQESLLENMRRAGRLSVSLMRLAAESIAALHRDAERTEASGGAAGILAVIEQNEAALAAKTGGVFDPQRVASYGTAAREFYGRVSALLEARRIGGLVRRCHGDLHLNNIFVLDGRPVLFDAIEFNDAFSCIDVLYDLAFLLMDLHRNGLRSHANAVLNRYLELAGEHSGLAALPLFLSSRAALRAHVAVSAAETVGNPEGYAEARLLLQHALDYLARPAPRLVAIGGVSGSGKSTLAYGLAPLLGAAPGAVVIRSDIIRKQLIGVEETTRLPQSAYAPEVTERVYVRMADIAATTLAAGYPAIADAVFGTQEERDLIATVAGRANVAFGGLWLEGPGSLLEERVAARRGDASDATVAVLHAQLSFVRRPENWAPMNMAVSVREAILKATQLLDIA